MKLKYSAVVAVVAALSMSVAGVASASAKNFIASKTGTLVGHALTNQVFETEAGGEAVTCETAETKGVVEAPLTRETSEVTVKYSDKGGPCEGPDGSEVTISEAHYLFTAPAGTGTTGSVKVLDPIELKLSAFFGLIKCTIEVTTSGNTKLETIEYENKSGKVVEKTNVTGITSKGSGSVCGSSTDTKGTYTGNSELELSGGTIEVK